MKGIFLDPLKNEGFKEYSLLRMEMRLFICGGRDWPRLATVGRGWPRLATVGRGLAAVGRGSATVGHG